MDPMQQMVQALKREVRMLRTECAYLRNQVIETGAREKKDEGKDRGSVEDYGVWFSCPFM